MTDETRDLQTATVMGKDLNHRQERFVQEFLVDLNATQAAIRAGYSEKGAHVRGSELLSIRKVRDAIEARKADLAERAGVTEEWVIEKLRDVHDASMGARPLIDKDGKEWGVQFNPSAANRSLELLGKHTGMFQEGHVAGDIQIQVNVHPHGDGPKEDH